MSARQRIIATVLIVATAALAAACGSTHPGAGLAPATGQVTTSLPIATSLAGPGQPGWAVVPMGGSSKGHDSFWELFVRATSSDQWKAATPPGVASNGGLAVAGVGSGLVAGFQPSQDLTFSPLASIASPAAAWSEGNALVNPGLASVPGALAAGPDHQLLALTRTGEVLLSTSDGTSWTHLTTLQSLQRTAAGRSCGLTALTAVAFGTGGVPLVGGSCARPGTAGIFAAEREAAAGVVPSLSAGSASPVTVLCLTTQANRTVAQIQLGAGYSTRVLAAWLPNGASQWTVSAADATGGGPPRSLDIWADGSAALVLAGGKADTISAMGSSWRSLPELPAGTATLALGPAGQLQALVPSGATLTVWQLAPSGVGWDRLQQLKVTIPDGSSG